MDWQIFTQEFAKFGLAGVLILYTLWENRQREARLIKGIAEERQSFERIIAEQNETHAKNIERMQDRFAEMLDSHDKSMTIALNQFKETITSVDQRHARFEQHLLDGHKT